VARCTDVVKIWDVELTPKLKIVLNFGVLMPRTSGAYSLRDVYKIWRVSLHYVLLSHVKFSLD